jgi:hypothetical protein
VKRFTEHRTLEDQALQAVLRQRLSELPTGARGAVFAYVKPDGTARLRTAIRVNNRWSVMADLDKRPGRAPEAQVVIEGWWL